MSELPVALGGPPGSGKSTAGRKAAKLLRLEYRSAGALFREEAERRGMDLSGFSRYAEEHDEVDRSLDETMLALAVPGRLLDGRLVGAMCRRNGVPAVYVVVTARPEVRYRRLSERDGQSILDTERMTLDREASERDRYRRYYGIDLDREAPDLTVDSSETPPDRVAATIAKFVRARAEAPGTAP